MDKIKDQQIILMDERIDSFLKGKMTIEEEEKFKAEIKSDSFLKQRAAERLLLLRGMNALKERDSVVIEAAKNNSIDDIYKSVGKNKNHSYFRKIGISIVAVACLVIAVIGINISMENPNTTDSENVAKAEYSKTDILCYMNEHSTDIISSFDTNSRGENDEELKHTLLVHFHNINNGDSLDVAIAALTPYFEQATNDEHDAVDDYAGAIGWFLAVAYYKERDIEKYKEILKKMMEEKLNQNIIEQLLIKL